jgi:hypothetical protein
MIFYHSPPPFYHSPPRDWLIDWLADWLIGWLTDWLIDWLIDWLPHMPHMPHMPHTPHMPHIITCTTCITCLTCPTAWSAQSAFYPKWPLSEWHTLKHKMLAHLKTLFSWMCKVCKMAPLGRGNQGLHPTVLHFHLGFLWKGSDSSVFEKCCLTPSPGGWPQAAGRLPGSQGTDKMTDFGFVTSLSVVECLLLAI